jgi:hypothetical protein
MDPQMRMYSYFLGLTAYALMKDAFDFMLKHVNFLITTAREARDEKLLEIYKRMHESLIELAKKLNDQRLELSDYYDEAVP